MQFYWTFTTTLLGKVLKSVQQRILMTQTNQDTRLCPKSELHKLSCLHPAYMGNQKFPCNTVRMQWYYNEAGMEKREKLRVDTKRLPSVNHRNTKPQIEAVLVSLFPLPA